MTTGKPISLPCSAFSATSPRVVPREHDGHGDALADEDRLAAAAAVGQKV
jgi:hypothetical protein